MPDGWAGVRALAGINKRQNLAFGSTHTPISHHISVRTFAHHLQTTVDAAPQPGGHCNGRETSNFLEIKYR